MNLRARDDRNRRRAVRAAKPYESRHSIQNRFKVTNTVNKIARGLGDFGQEHTSFKPKFTEAPKTDKDLLDKYYIASHSPPRDVLTELGAYGELTFSKVKGTLAGLIVGLITGVIFEHFIVINNVYLDEVAAPLAISASALITYWMIS